MPGKPDAGNIGQDRGVQDPAQGQQQYVDPVDSMSDDEKLPMGQMPQAPDPSPFTINGGGSGER